MAFRQLTHHAPQRVYTAPEETQTSQKTPQISSQPLQESQEWILFSPQTASITDGTYTTSTGRTRTVGLSRISDFGSLDTAARSYGYDEVSEHTEAGVEEESTGELDSLDDHLKDFREPSSYKQSVEASGSVLPTHDGLGSFRVDRTAVGEAVQQDLYAFDRFNPRRTKRRRESLELGELEPENERVEEQERTRRIEAWRMEQSRVLVDEIQRETRRRKQSMSSEKFTIDDRQQEDLATLSNVEEHEEETGEETSFWNKITTKVIRDLIGIDDDLLSIIFGEKLPEDDDLSSTLPANHSLDSSNSMILTEQFDRFSWEHRLIARIARELGILVNQLSHHPGAFTTYLETQKTPIPYAGLPAIPEGARDTPTPILEPETSFITQAVATPEFQPTIQQPLSSPTSPTADETRHSSFTKEEWERDLDVKMVFRYLRSRFTSSSPTPNTYASSSQTHYSLQNTHGTSHLATASTTDTAARAARVRAQHPLVSVNVVGRGRERKRWSGSAGREGMLLRRRSTASCGISAITGRSGKTRSGSSRHYWDWERERGSLGGSGSLVGTVGGMGSWGEV